ncbi:MAG TPA: hypothetical protein PLU30_00370 [Verrucomicrobiae bacterium]|nr:hypothetical protein [Verrucomicrobiae bacterium]
MILLLLILLGCWCWFGAGPLCLRWPVIVLLVLLTSDHWASPAVAAQLDALAGPLLTLGIMFFGLWIIVRGAFGWPRYRRYYDPYYRRRWHDRHW